MNKKELLTSEHADLVKEIAIEFRNNYTRFFSKGEEQFEHYKQYVLKQEKDWEILSFISNKGLGRIHANTVLTKREDNTFTSDNLKGDVIHAVEIFLLNDSKWDIYSVKRKSDGEIFTVGDEIISEIVKKEYHNIISFKISSSNIIQVVCTGNYTTELSLCKKAKQSLFKSFDGQDIFEGDNFYKVDINAKTITIMICISTYKELNSDFKYFKSKEKAEEYLINNAKVLSIADCSNIIDYKIKETFVNIEKLIKQRLNLK